MKHASGRFLAIALACVACVACSSDVDRDSGLDAILRVRGGQFYRGPFPSASGGPEVRAVHVGASTVRPGMVDKPVSGAVDRAGSAVAIALAGDRGYWIVPTGVPDVQAPEFPTFSVQLSFAGQLPVKPHSLVVSASDSNGRFGPLHTDELRVRNVGDVEGELVVSLSWDTNADLDLHVTDPHGVEIYRANVNSVEPPPPGEPVDPNAWKVGGRLDFDSNEQCVIDGANRENIVWTTAPPAGHYAVRVDAFSMCGQAVANWDLRVLVRGTEYGHVRGTALPTDTRGPHDRGAGLLVLEFDVP